MHFHLRFLLLAFEKIFIESWQLEWKASECVFKNINPCFSGCIVLSAVTKMSMSSTCVLDLTLLIVILTSAHQTFQQTWELGPTKIGLTPLVLLDFSNVIAYLPLMDSTWYCDGLVQHFWIFDCIECSVNLIFWLIYLLLDNNLGLGQNSPNVGDLLNVRRWTNAGLMLA